MTPTAAPLYPTAPLPGPAGRVAAALAATHQLPTHLTALAALGTLSAATRGRWRVQAAPGWTEPLALYALGLAGPGTRKSAVVRALSAPLLARDRELERETLAARVAAATGREIATRRRDAVLTAATHGTDAERAEAVREAAALQQRIDAIGEPRAVSLWFHDVTPAALPALLARYGASAHLGDGYLLHALADTDDTAGLTALTKGYDGARLRVDRIGRPSVDVAEPFLAAVMLGQPHVLDAARRDPALRPLLARFLFAVAEPAVGTRSVDAPDVPDEVTAEWDRTVRALLDTALAAETVTTLELTPEAAEAFAEFRAAWEPRLHAATGDLADIQAWVIKHPGRVARIAALLALADDPETTAVGVEYVWAAVNLAETHVAGARAALAGAEVAA
ncbi:DUF3987 domain-containing protein [Parafrankia sp. FMc2]|uniref:DUF3987 domain-containing protein n=1 Tax=Parafrankia sp. FMc2 TaxID=3233196 RepID=UPI0034D3E842